MPAHDLPPFLAQVTIPGDVSITYVSPAVADPFNASVYYDGQVMVVEGPRGRFSIEAHGATRLSDGLRSWADPEDLREAFPQGNAGKLEGAETSTGNRFSYLLANWFDIFDVPQDEDDEWYGRDYAFSTLEEALTEAVALAS